MSKTEQGVETQIPIACNLTEPGQMQQRQSEILGMFKAVEQVEELVDGYAFRFAPDGQLASQLLSFILSERECCPFFTFELVFEPAEGPIYLRLRGPEGVKDFVKEAFYPGNISLTR